MRTAKIADLVSRGALFLAVGAALLSWNMHFAEASTNEELEQVRKEIQQHRNSVKKYQNDLAALKKQLAQDEKAFREISKKLQEYENHLGAVKTKLSALEKTQEELLAKKKIQQMYLARQIADAYQLGSDDYAKLVLNQEDPNQIGRTLEYHIYMNKARTKLIDEIDSTIADIKAGHELIAQNNADLLKAYEDRKNIAEAVKIRKAQREETAKAIAESIGEEKKLIAQLQVTEKKLITEIEANKKKLAQEQKEKEAREIAKAKEEAKKAGLSENDAAKAKQDALEKNKPKGLSDLKGKMPWPTDGSIAKSFGQSRAGELTWTGLLIRSKSGRTKSSGNGIVVLAGPLDGYGLIVAVDHGQDYLSLYANNKELFVAVGDSVKAGDALGTIDLESGNLESALYFEIRHRGVPLNPSKWLKKR